MSVVYWSSYSIYFKTLTYFSVANPKIYLGGMLDERKTDIYDLVPKNYLPATKMYENGIIDYIEDVEQNFDFPVILKPNVGFRGFMVKKIDNSDELRSVATEYGDKELLVQEYLTEEHEYSAMYYYVDQNNFGISSLVEKHLPKVKGDGERTLRELIEASENPFLHKSWVAKKNHNQLDKVVPSGQLYTVDHVGNYARGSKFENLNHLIDKDLLESVRRFYTQVEGMNFCRMDVKAHSLKELKEGKFKLLEINGAKSEPLHIYDPRLSLLQIIKDIHRHWSLLFTIVRKNIKLMDFPSSREGIKSYYSLKKMVS